jgi:hypothetical protein
MWSLHHSGNAVDVRTITLPDGGVGSISAQIATALQETMNARPGRGRYTVLRNDQGPTKPHIHVQYNKGGRWSEPGDFGFGNPERLKERIGRTRKRCGQHPTRFAMLAGRNKGPA